MRAMMDKLGKRARLTVLARRELENYLLDPGAIEMFAKHIIPAFR